VGEIFAGTAAVIGALLFNSFNSRLNKPVSNNHPCGALHMFG
jgi:hypothetical protein